MAPSFKLSGARCPDILCRACRNTVQPKVAGTFLNLFLHEVVCHECLCTLDNRIWSLFVVNTRLIDLDRGFAQVDVIRYLKGRDYVSVVAYSSLKQIGAARLTGRRGLVVGGRAQLMRGRKSVENNK